MIFTGGCVHNVPLVLFLSVLGCKCLMWKYTRIKKEITQAAIAATGFLVMVVISGCSTPLVKGVTEPAVNSTRVIKSPADNREYKFVTLPSGLRALLISDPKTDKSAAAVDVGVGSFHDPDDRLGLAHFLEHMLFMGSKKYPEVDGYFQYIRANGGSANAYTADMRTNYFFDINSDKLRPALDRLAQFFVSPTLDPKYVDRERHAVDSEYRLHTREDSWRLSMALNAISNPQHPKSRFFIGSLDTLSNDDHKSLWQDLKTFYDKYYAADNIRVVLYGRESTETLEQWVKDAFKGVPAHPSADTHIGIRPYTSNELGVRINLKPLKETRVLSLNFPLKSTQPYYQKKPLGYLARLIGYEGKGSLHSLLKARGYINSLGAYSNDVPNEYAEFIVRMELTPEGLEHVDTITTTVFDYLNLIRKEGIQERLYAENKAIADLGFRYQEERSPQQTVSALAARMGFLPAAHILNANYLYSEFDPALIRQFLDQFTPANLRQVVIAPGVSTDKVEPYFQTHYSVRPLSKTLVNRLDQPQFHTGLSIPEPNTFIARDFKLRTSDRSLTPAHIINKPGINVWSLTDSSFTIPRATVRVKISTSEASAKPSDIANLQVYRALLSRSLNEYGYPAREAGLYYGISAGREGLMLSLSGYQDKQSVLLEQLLKGITGFNPEKAAFEQEKAQLVRGLKNKAFQPPYRLAMDAVNQVIYPNYPSDAVLLNAAESVTFEDLKRFAHDFYQHINVEMLVHGNHSETAVKKLAGQVEQALLTPANRSQRYDEPYHLLADQQRTLELDIRHNDSVFVAYFQRPETDSVTRAHYALLGRLLATPFFNSLRTEQQLGYVVHASARPVEKHPGIVFVVQSPRADSVEIERHVDTFLKERVKRFEQLTDAELAGYREGLVGALLKRDSNLDERGARFWQSIDSQEPFDNREQIAKAVNNTTVADMRRALATLVKGRGRLIVRSFGGGHQQAKANAADDVNVCRDVACFDDLPRG